MRTILTAAIILATAAMVSAQQQERKLIDRLLKPDTSLQNTAQGKEFIARGGAVSTKKATTKSFYVASRSPEKEYTNVRSVDGKAFRTKESPLAQEKANTSSRTKLARIDDPYPTSTYDTRRARDAGKTVQVSNYSDTRPFLVRGKSQKALSAQDRPLTIEQVRELLNKNE